MRHACVLTLMALFFFYATPTLAGQYDRNGIRDLITLGLEVNLGLQLENLDVAKGKEAIEQERSIFDSTFFAVAEYKRSVFPYDSTMSLSSESRSEDFSGQMGLRKQFKTGLMSSVSLDSQWLSDNESSENLDPRYRTALVLELSQPLLQNFGTAVNTTLLNVSKNKERQAVLNYLLSAQNLILQLEVAARQLAEKAEIIKLRQQSLALSHELYAANQKRFKAGVIAVTEIQEAETEVAARQLALSLAIQEQDLLKEDINRQLNQDLPEDFNPEDLVDFEEGIKPLTLPLLEDLVETAQRQRLELKISDFSIQSSSLQQDYLRNQLKPQLDLNLQFGLNGLSGDKRTSTPRGEYSGHWLDSFAGASEADGYRWQAGFELTMPIGNRAAKSRYRQAKLQLRQDRYRYKDLESIIRNDLLQQQINISQTRKQLEITERVEALAKKSLDQEQRRLQEGLSDTFRIIIFQQRMVEAMVDRVNAFTRYHLALAQMDFALGHTFKRHHIVLRNNTEELTLENI